MSRTAKHRFMLIPPQQPVGEASFSAANPAVVIDENGHEAIQMTRIKRANKQRLSDVDNDEDPLILSSVPNAHLVSCPLV